MTSVEHLNRVDPIMRGLIRKVGPCRMRHDSGGDPPSSPWSGRWPTSNSTARPPRPSWGGSRRWSAGKRFPAPAGLWGTGRRTAARLRFLAGQNRRHPRYRRQDRVGLVPTSRRIARMSDEVIIERLTEVRAGAGRWRCCSCSKLGRPDVLPVDDFGLRNGFGCCTGCPSCRSRGRSSSTANGGVRFGRRRRGICGGRRSCRR